MKRKTYALLVSKATTLLREGKSRPEVIKTLHMSPKAFSNMMYYYQKKKPVIKPKTTQLNSDMLTYLKQGEEWLYQSLRSRHLKSLDQAHLCLLLALGAALQDHSQ